MSETLACPSCGHQLPKSRLLGTSALGKARCQSCGAEVRLKLWVLMALGALAGVIGPAAAITAILYWSVVPLAALFIVMGVAYTAVYVHMHHLLTVTKRAGGP